MRSQAERGESLADVGAELCTPGTETAATVRLLNLQRSFGNRSVLALLSVQAAKRPVVQRHADGGIPHRHVERAWQHPDVARLAYPSRDRLLRQYLRLWVPLQRREVERLPSGLQRVAYLRKLGEIESSMTASGADLVQLVESTFGLPGAIPPWAREAVVQLSGIRYNARSGAHGTWLPLVPLLRLLAQQRLIPAPASGLTESDAAVEFERLQHANAFPAPVWQRIADQSDLRLRQPGGTWQQAAGAVTAPWSTVLATWQRQYQQAWRAASRPSRGRAGTLVNVTSVVCDQMAEILQHRRGLAVPGGFRQATTWFRNAVVHGLPQQGASATTEAAGSLPSPEQAPGASTLVAPYFLGVPDKRPEHFRPGAVIYYVARWDRFSPDRTVQPLPRVNYYMENGPGDDDEARIETTAKLHGGFEYQRDERSVTRRPIAADGSTGGAPMEHLAYGHVATVLAVDGQRILTLEAGFDPAAAGRPSGGGPPPPMGAGVQERRSRAGGSLTDHVQSRWVYVAWSPER